MRVAFDAHMIGTRETGNEAYAVGVLRGLAHLADGGEYDLLTPHPDRITLQLPPAFRTVRIWPSTSWWRIPVAIPIAAWRRKADVLHMTTYVAPPRSPCPMVVTIHDLSYLAYPNAFSRRVRTILTRLVPGSVARATCVIAVSEFTKQDVVRHYGTPPENIVVTHLAPAPAFTRLGGPEPAALPAGVAGPFILAVGNLEPRKNLRRLIDAFAILVRDRRFTGQLVLVGKRTAADQELERLITDLGLESRVVFTGFVSEADLVRLYNRASVFAYPSLYEGFGLPPLEAMACGCPVVASNVTAIPEVLGTAALLVDPLDPAAIAQALGSVLDRPELAGKLREMGLRRAAEFSWDRTGRITQEVYERAARAPRRQAGAAP
jgi:glycosyltransferase involved in cell wall biosynthesis